MLQQQQKLDQKEQQLQEERILQIRERQRLQNETIKMQQQKELHRQKIQNEKEHQRHQNTELHKQNQIEDSRGNTTKRATTDCKEITKSLSKLQATREGKRRRSQANKRKKRNEIYQQKLKAKAEAEATASEQDHPSEPMLRPLRPTMSSTYSSDSEQPSTSNAHRDSCDITYGQNRQDDYIHKVPQQQRKNEETEYAGTFVRKNSKERYYSTKTYYPRPIIRTISTSEDSDFDSEQDE